MQNKLKLFSFSICLNSLWLSSAFGLQLHLVTTLKNTAFATTYESMYVNLDRNSPYVVLKDNAKNKNIVWDLNAQDEARELDGYIINYAKDGNTFFTTQDLTTIDVWNLQQSAKLFSTSEEFDSVSANSRYFLAYQNRVFGVFDVHTGQNLVDGKKLGMNLANASFSDDGTKVVAEGQIFDIGSGKKLCSFVPHYVSQARIMFSKDGSRFLQDDGQSSAITDIATCKAVVQGLPSGSKALSRNGNLAIFVGDSEFSVLYDVKLRKVIETFTGNDCAFSDDEKRVLCKEPTREYTTRRIYDLSSQRLLGEVEDYGGFDAFGRVATSKDMHLLLYFDGETSRLYDVDSKSSAEIAEGAMLADNDRFIVNQLGPDLQIWEIIQ